MSVKWPTDDCRNHEADRVDTSQVNFDIDCLYEFIELQAEDIVNSLIIAHSLSLYLKDYSIKLTTGDSSHTYRRETNIERR